MKKLFLSVAVMGALSFSAVSQNDQKKAQTDQNTVMTPEQKSDKQLANATKLLNLTEGQKVKFRQFALEKNTAIYALKEKEKGADKTTVNDLKAQAQTYREKFRANVKSILNLDQQTKFAEILKKMDEANAEHNHNHSN